MAPTGIRPQMFKTLIGRGHPEFSTKRQQDAQEFFLHLLTELERSNRGQFNPSECFKFQVVDRVECSVSKKVKYTDRSDYLLQLPVPLDRVINKDAVTAYEAKKAALEKEGKKLDPTELVRPRIPMSSCIEALMATESIEGFYSTAIKATTVANKTTRLLTFPDYLMIQIRKFTLGDDWVPKKLDVSIDVPQELDISCLRGSGLQPGEEELPEANAQPEVQLDEGVIAQLADMGFPVEGCKKAVFHTNNAGAEAAMNWVMEHMGDPDFATPFVMPGAKKSSSSTFVPNEEALMMIMSMGFTREQATKALKATDNNLERAADWVFSHAAELDAPMETEEATSSGGPQCRDGSGKYKLVAFISHMGTSTMVGHYVCHILKDNRWVIFNDEKVALSEHPPMDLGYLYLYKRL